MNAQLREQYQIPTAACDIAYQRVFHAHAQHGPAAAMFDSASHHCCAKCYRATNAHSILGPVEFFTCVATGVPREFADTFTGILASMQRVSYCNRFGYVYASVKPSAGNLTSGALSYKSFVWQHARHKCSAATVKLEEAIQKLGHTFAAASFSSAVMVVTWPKPQLIIVFKCVHSVRVPACITTVAFEESQGTLLPGSLVVHGTSTLI